MDNNIRIQKLITYKGYQKLINPVKHTLFIFRKYIPTRLLNEVFETALIYLKNI